MDAPNPILPGFNPDPSIIRVGKDYYVATSTFEWFPGVRIYHSTDLSHWTFVGSPLSRVSQLELKGVPDSCGVWAPCLTYADGIFYLVYSVVQTFDGPWLDTPNFLVTAKDIREPWSDPISLGSSGFDGSLFHDDDGKKWFVSMLHDSRGGKFFGGIILQEYDPGRMQLIGAQRSIFSGTSLGSTEGPHLYKKDGFYYLITAEGGTEYGHAVSIARSKNLFGPYEIHPENPVLTAAYSVTHPLQKSGHADLVESENGDWLMVYLVGRPLTERGRCILGRETAIEEVVWRGGWLYTASGSKLPEIRQNPVLQNRRYDFTAGVDPDFQSLREPADSSWLRVDPKRGLVLKGRNSLSSLHAQSLLARRLQHFQVEVTVGLSFKPTSFQQMAGLVFYYNTNHYHYLHLRGCDSGQTEILCVTNNKDKIVESLAQPIREDEVFLRGVLRMETLHFYFSVDQEVWQPIGDTLDASILSDDYVANGHIYRPAFTGCMIGIACQDLTGRGLEADFKWYHYQELEP